MSDDDGFYGTCLPAIGAHLTLDQVVHDNTITFA